MAAGTETDTGRTTSGADSVLPSIAEWEKTQNGFVQARNTQTRRSSHEAHRCYSRRTRDSRSQRRGVAQDLVGHVWLDPVLREAEA